MTVLITGILSGLGKYIYENLGGIGLSRINHIDEVEKIKDIGVDIVIHCAFNTRRGITSNSLYQYLDDNLFLTQELVSLPNKKFIYISSVDVYPKDGNVHSEEEIIDMDSISGIYGINKLASESVVMNCCKNYIILRPTTLVGKYSRKNTLFKVIEDKQCAVGISGDSVFNYILHSDVLSFINHAIEKDLQGIYNVASSENIILSDVANIVGNSVQFGSHKYDVGRISNTKISGIYPRFSRTSAQILDEFLKGYGN